jgi:hypothetical protein
LRAGGIGVMLFHNSPIRPSVGFIVGTTLNWPETVQAFKNDIFDHNIYFKTYVDFEMRLK